MNSRSDQSQEPFALEKVATSWENVERELALALQVYTANQILILQVKQSGRYLQVLVEEGPKLLAELSSNDVLVPREHFTAWEWAGLLRLGWGEPGTGRSPNFSLTIEGKEAPVRVARLAVQSFSQVMEMSPTGSLELTAFTSSGSPIVLPQVAKALGRPPRVRRPGDA
jgi:hypothetical protein